MKIEIDELHDQIRTPLEGTPQEVRGQLLARFPWLVRRGGAEDGLDALLDRLGHAQGYLVRVLQEDMGKSERLADPFEAARWLSGQDHPDPGARRSALWAADGDRVAAALTLHGLGDTPEARASLEVWGRLRPGRAQAEDAPLEPQEVAALFAEGEEAAQGVRRAFEARLVRPANLGGQHSAGTLFAQDQGEAWILKPGSGDSPIRGEDEEPASAARREVGFWQVARAWDMAQWIPRTDLLRVGEREYAAVAYLGRRFSVLEDLERESPGFSARVLQRYFADGVLHRWAALDYILGNGDRNAQNIMCDDQGQVRLIDHGSAFAGESFSPATDQASFVPYPLRVWAPLQFNALSRGEKLARMPRLAARDELALRAWLLGLDWNLALWVLTRYGLRPDPVLGRLEQLRQASENGADLAVLSAWV